MGQEKNATERYRKTQNKAWSEEQKQETTPARPPF
jgi:hypothetical protein